MKTPNVRWLLGAALLAGGCGTATAFKTTSTNPSVRPFALDGQTVVVLVMSTQDVTRRAGEDTVAAKVTALGARGVAASTILPTADLQDEAKVRTALAEAGAVAVVVMQIVPEGPRARPVGGSIRAGSQTSFWNNYRWARGNAWSGGPLPDAAVWVETLVYTLQPDELIWSGRSRTVNPGDFTSLFASVSNAAAGEIARAGLLKSPPQ